jgi:hypothetical protein
LFNLEAFEPPATATQNITKAVKKSESKIMKLRMNKVVAESSTGSSMNASQVRKPNTGTQAGTIALEVETEEKLVPNEVCINVSLT